MAVPEVPITTRIRLLEFGRQRGSLNVASILSSEINDFRALEGFHYTDIIFVNIDEAGHIGNTDPDSPSADIVNNCINVLKDLNPAISAVITNGANGSYCYTDNRLSHTPAIKVNALSTAGAGDAFLAGTLTGLCCGLLLTSAVGLGTLLAAFSVTSADTIHPDANAETLYDFALRHAPDHARAFTRLFNPNST